MKVFTVNDVAAMLKVSRSTVYNAIESGALPHHRFGKGRGAIRISDEQLQQYLSNTKVAEAPATSVPLKEVKYRGKSPA
jgi:excisionase family DNA binding protein